jgi:hypothetical protein
VIDAEAVRRASKARTGEAVSFFVRPEGSTPVRILDVEIVDVEPAPDYIVVEYPTRPYRE